MPWEQMVYLPRFVMPKRDFDRITSMFSWAWKYLSPPHLSPTRPIPVKVDMDRDIFTFSGELFFVEHDAVVSPDQDNATQVVCEPLELLHPRVPDDHWFFKIKRLALCVPPTNDGELHYTGRYVFWRMKSLRTILLVLPPFFNRFDIVMPTRSINGISMPTSTPNNKDAALVDRHSRYIHIEALSPQVQAIARRMTDNFRDMILEGCQHLSKLKFEIVLDTLE